MKIKSYEIYEPDFKIIIDKLTNLMEQAYNETITDQVEFSFELGKAIDKLKDSSWEITNND